MFFIARTVAPMLMGSCGLLRTTTTCESSDTGDGGNGRRGASTLAAARRGQSSGGAGRRARAHLSRVPASPAPAPPTLTALFDATFRTRADALALEYDAADGTRRLLTFADVEARALRMAAVLRARGLTAEIGRAHV